MCIVIVIITIIIRNMHNKYQVFLARIFLCKSVYYFQHAGYIVWPWRAIIFIITATVFISYPHIMAIRCSDRTNKTSFHRTNMYSNSWLVCNQFLPYSHFQVPLFLISFSFSISFHSFEISSFFFQPLSVVALVGIIFLLNIFFFFAVLIECMNKWSKSPQTVYKIILWIL